MLGILSLQGDFAEHYEQCREHGFEVIQVRTLAELSAVNGLIIPGGESTTIGKLLELTGLAPLIKRRYADGNLKIWGTCAGAILCAGEVVTKKPVLNLGLEGYKIERNSYGSQQDSFEAELEFSGLEGTVRAAFIRAPRLLDLPSDFEVLASHRGEPVFARKGNLLVSTCHPELYENVEFYKWLKEWVK